MVIPQKIKNKINILPSNFTYGAYGCIYKYIVYVCVGGCVCSQKWDTDLPNFYTSNLPGFGKESRISGKFALGS